MRTPTTAPQALRWHNQAMSDIAMHLSLEVDYDDPQCGWFLTRLSKGGPLLPARIWLEQEVCPQTGQLLSDEVLKCEINGQLHDPEKAWLWMASEPIEEQAYTYLIARKDFAETYAPHEPAANPFAKVDWSQVPTPTFSKDATP